MSAVWLFDEKVLEAAIFAVVERTDAAYRIEVLAHVEAMRNFLYDTPEMQRVMITKPDEEPLG